MGKVIVQPLKIKYMNQIIWIYIVSFIVIFIVPIQMVKYFGMTLLALYIISVSFVYSEVWRKNQISDKELFYLFFSFSAAVSGILWGGIKTQLYFSIPAYPFDYLAVELGLASFLVESLSHEQSKSKKLGGRTPIG